MWGKLLKHSIWVKSALGAMLAALCGLLLWGTSLGDPWVNASYDYLFRFGSRAVTNQVSLILMDNAAYDEFHQLRDQPWDRALHAQLLNRLADDGCKMVVMDTFFRVPRNPEKDAALATAMRRQKNLVLMAEQSEVMHPALAGAKPILPDKLFLDAAGTNWGVAWLNPDLDSVVRKQWPFPNPGPYPSLPWKAAELAGAKLTAVSQARWIRYYGQPEPWTRLSYRFALLQPAGFFRDQIVFIGLEPKTTLPNDGETDEFSTPYTRWTHETSGGVGILLASFLNLLNDDSLQRPSGTGELFLLLAAGIVIGGGLGRLRRKWACVLGALIFLAVSVSAIVLTHYTHYWFPWLIVAGGQLPCALVWSIAVNLRRAPVIASLPDELVIDTPGYELAKPSFAEGAYGKLWLARNQAGQWRALKVVYQARFGEDAEPFEREYAGVQKYKPISDRHPGLLRVDFVSEKKNGCFYYVMELADSMVAGWEQAPTTYKPRDLVSERAVLHKKRLPVRDCFRLGIQLCEALEFLHQQGMTHRDIKPQNIIFVNGQPKLADLGLITGIRPLGHEGTLVGTPGFMPPAPERPGTISADIYALGMVLYVLATGRSAALFPELATTLISTEEPPEFLPLNDVILKACQPDPKDRYATAADLRGALQDGLDKLETFKNP